MIIRHREVIQSYVDQLISSLVDRREIDFVEDLDQAQELVHNDLFQL